MKPRRLLVIGLDGLDPRMVFGSAQNQLPRLELPNLAKLMNQGRYGPLMSCFPPLTIPAWISMFTGLDPGQLGCYGFRNRLQYDYETIRLGSIPGSVQAPRVWDVLSQHGFRSLVLGVPGTYPPWPIRGRMVSSILAPSTNAAFTWPAKLQLALLKRNYQLDVDGFRNLNPHELHARCCQMMHTRFAVAKEWAKESSWDLFVLVEIATDRLHHGLWSSYDTSHPGYQKGPASELLPDFYTKLDQQIGELLGCLDSKTAILVVSDHGTQALLGGFRINQWLIQQGDLVLKENLFGPTLLEPKLVDWSKTKAWAEGGHYARVFLNVRGREPQGCLRPTDYHVYGRELAQRLETTCDTQGELLGTKVYWPHQLYEQQRRISPDLLVYLGNLRWRALGQVGFETVYTQHNDTGPDDANHAQQGIFIYFEPGRDTRQHPVCKSIFQVSGLILDRFGLC